MFKDMRMRAAKGHGTPSLSAQGQRRKAYSYIRFSDIKQEEGASLSRQRGGAEKYAKEHNLVLDTSLTVKGVTTKLEDLGVRAYQGRNRTRGALSVFLDAVRQGLIVPGSILIVESLDRLTREPPTKAFRLLLDIIDAGITIVTLAPFEEYNEQTVNNENRLWMAVGIIYRSHEESKTKAERVRNGWAEKKEKTRRGEVILTKVCPAWLRPKDDLTGFKIIPERAAVVRKIFRYARKGMSKLPIARALNMEKVPAWNDSNDWHPNYIHRILTNPAVFGRFQPGQYTETGRKPDGDPIDNYYPAVISRAQFEQIRARPKRPPGPSGGPKGDRVSNLVAGIAWDGHSGHKMYFWNKGNKKQGHTCCHYLVSDALRRGKGLANSWNYVRFEKVFLDYLRELDWAEVADEANNEDIQEWEKRKTLVSAQQEDLEQRLRKLRDLVQTSDVGDLPETILQDMRALETGIKEKQNELDALDKLGEREHYGQDALRQGSDELRKLLDLNDAMTRLRLKDEIRRKVARIDMFAHGLDNYEVFRGMTAKVDLPCYRITFTNGAIRWVAAPGVRGRRSEAGSFIPVIIDQKKHRVTLMRGEETLDITSVNAVDLRPIKLVSEELRDLGNTAAIVEQAKKMIFTLPAGERKGGGDKSGKASSEKKGSPRRSRP